MKSKINKIPTLIGMIILAAGVFLGVYMLNTRQVFNTRANSSAAPKDVRISNTSSSSFTISWATDIETSGFVQWGESLNDLSETSIETEGNTKTFTHFLTLSGLKPQISYYFKINSNGSLFDNNGMAWQFKTLNESTTKKDRILVTGSVINASGTPIDKALVYINIANNLFSSSTSQTGNFILPIEQERLDKNSTLLQIFVQQTPEKVATAQVYPKSTNPIPPIIIGQNHDFKNEPESKTNGNPNVNLNLPSDLEKNSKFIIPAATSVSVPAVTLKSLTEGETITSTTPEFLGEGPKGQTFTIKVESENPITDEVKIGNNGTWKWAVPENLAAGVHKLTISWKENGITKTLTRNFIVQAGELPAFEATPSEGLATATPTATSKATSKPTSTATASAKPVPETGVGSYTFIFITFALLTFLFSSYLWKTSDVY